MLDVTRTEVKYDIGPLQMADMKRQLGIFMEPDPHNGERGYLVRSLYFDTLHDTDFEEKVEGYDGRQKIRLRVYGVGAQSIVRFRTAIKDPRDTAYIFWGIAVGICCGVSDYLIAAIGSALIFAFLILFGFIRDNGRIMVIVNGEPGAGEEVEKHMGNLFGGKAALRVHNRAVKTQTEEFIYEISDKQLKKSEKRNGKLVRNLSGIEGVTSVSMVRQDDEINQ